MNELNEMVLDIPLAWRCVGGGILGAIVGSFIATLVIRWPEDRSAAAGRSQCDSCGRKLGVIELIPLVGYLVNRGRCRSCKAAIDPLHPLIELGAAAIGACAFAVQPSLFGLAGAVFGWALLLLAALDVRHFWLPDRVTLPLIVIGLGSAWLFQTPSMASAAIGAASGYLIFVVINWLYRLLRGQDGLGGGDSKLMAAIGAWLGWQMLPLILLLASTTGLVVVLIAAMRGDRISPFDRVPFGAFLAVVAWPLWIARDALSGIMPGI